MGEPTRFRNRDLIMAPEDWRLVSDALTQKFPEARYFVEPTNRQCRRPRHDPPRMIFTKTLWRAIGIATRLQSEVTVTFDPTWRPIWYFDENPSYFHSWRYWPPRHPTAEFSQVGGARRFMYRPPDIMRCWLVVRCNPYFAEQSRLAGRFHHTIARFTSNRNLAKCAYPSGRLISMAPSKGGDLWVGHHARRWSEADENQFLEVHPQRPQGLRPVAVAAAAAAATEIIDPIRRRRPVASTAMPDVHYRCHFAALASDDLLAFSAGLASAFPGARFLLDPTSYPLSLKQRSKHVLVAPTLARAARPAKLWRRAITMVLDPGWRPMWRRELAAPSHTLRALYSPRGPTLTIDPDAVPPVHKSAPSAARFGVLCIRYDPADAAERSVADRVSALLAQIASNRMCAEIDHDTGAVGARHVDNPAWGWIGHAARRWALADPRRAIGFFYQYNPTQWLRPIPEDSAIPATANQPQSP